MSAMSGFFSVLTLVCCGLVLKVAWAGGDQDVPFERTEKRAPCTNYQENRQPFFGDLHVHTTLSSDAFVYGNRNSPRDAYAFSQGAALGLPPLDAKGNPTRTAQIDRPLDFAAVTDHAEFLGEILICQNPDLPGFDSIACRIIRGEAGIPPVLANLLWDQHVRLGIELAMCRKAGVNCDSAAASAWAEVQSAAEEAYDRTSTCDFTTFVAYEHTTTFGPNNTHRNVIFRNERVQAIPTSSYETGGPNPPALWAALQQQCLDGEPGCDVLAIPHNSNLSGGFMFPDPTDQTEAMTRVFFEPLIEIYQTKASSECRFDSALGVGTDTNDELCAFEQAPFLNFAFQPGPPADQFPRRTVVRNILKDGLALQQSMGVNPFRLGVVGGTDTHIGTAGLVSERDYPGHNGTLDSGPLGTGLPAKPTIYGSSGGLTVIWAEENSRDALFEAMQRRETYATSGTRPIVRFFGGFELYDGLCDESDWVKKAYENGVPMGGDLVRDDDDNPRFLVSALQDVASVPLQRVQIIKGWVDASGQVHERVYDVAGDPNNGARVDPSTCNPVGDGFSDLCAVWEDKEFDPNQRAFYYARVLENPTCRWSTRVCKNLGIDPFAANCTKLAPQVKPFSACCLNEGTTPALEPVIQERAWTSSIWYTPGEGSDSDDD